MVAIINSDGQVKERITYDAYGRPHCFSPGDLKTNSGADRPDGNLNVNDSWTIGSVLWNKDIGNSSGLAIPDGTVDANDGTTLTNLKAAGFSGGYGILSSSAVGNRRGFAGYEFDPVLEGSASANNKPVYHVRHRVLACDTGKWFQKDPLGYHDSMDLYEYCGSDPEDKGDPQGLCTKASAHERKVDPPDWGPFGEPTNPVEPGPTQIQKLAKCKGNARVDAAWKYMLKSCRGRTLGVTVDMCGPNENKDCANSSLCAATGPTGAIDQIAICICTDRNGTPNCPTLDICDTLTEELIHAAQLCALDKEKRLKKSGRMKLCQEIGAHWYYEPAAVPLFCDSLCQFYWENAGYASKLDCELECWSMWETCSKWNPDHPGFVPDFPSFETAATNRINQGLRTASQATSCSKSGACRK